MVQFASSLSTVAIAIAKLTSAAARLYCKFYADYGKFSVPAASKGFQRVREELSKSKPRCQAAQDTQYLLRLRNVADAGLIIEIHGIHWYT